MREFKRNKEKKWKIDLINWKYAKKGRRKVNLGIGNLA